MQAIVEKFDNFFIKEEIALTKKNEKLSQLDKNINKCNISLQSLFEQIDKKHPNVSKDFLREVVTIGWSTNELIEEAEKSNIFEVLNTLLDTHDLELRRIVLRILVNFSYNNNKKKLRVSGVIPKVISFLLSDNIVLSVFSYTILKQMADIDLENKYIIRYFIESQFKKQEGTLKSKYENIYEIIS